MFTINILHRLLLMGFIEKSKDSGTIYDDTEFKELSQFLKTLLEVFSLILDELKKELGTMTEEVLDRAKGSLREDYGRIFHGISSDGDISTDTNLVLKNIAINYPNPSDRLVFIDGFHELMSNTLQEMKQILGIPLTKHVVKEVRKIRREVLKFCADSPAKKLDRLDCRLIQLLQKDGRLPNNAIAQELGISEFTVRRRLKRLLDSRIIKIVAVANPMDLGFEIAGNLKIRIDLKQADDVLEELKKLDALIWVALTTGGTDIDVDFVVRSLKEFHELVFKKISKIDGVLSTEASLMVDLVKDEHDWGTAWD